MSAVGGRSCGLAVLAAAVLVTGCGGAGSGGRPATGAARGTPTTSTQAGSTAVGELALASSAFASGGAMPARYTCNGAGVSPPLRWSGVPSGTAELFLLAVDLSGGPGDAIQWALGGIPPSVAQLPTGSLPPGVVVGLNSRGKAAWGGVCGARGQLHHVAFLLYALRRKLGLAAGFDPVLAREQLKSATLASGLTLATYRRP